MASSPRARRRRNGGFNLIVTSGGRAGASGFGPRRPHPRLDIAGSCANFGGTWEGQGAIVEENLPGARQPAARAARAAAGGAEAGAVQGAAHRGRTGRGRARRPPQRPRRMAGSARRRNVFLSRPHRQRAERIRTNGVSGAACPRSAASGSMRAPGIPRRSARRPAASARSGRSPARRSGSANFEKLLAGGGTLIVKVWLHLSKEAQGRRLRTLRADPATAWRVTDEDWHHHRIYDRLAKTGPVHPRRDRPARRALDHRSTPRTSAPATWRSGSCCWRSSGNSSARWRACGRRPRRGG